MTDTMIKRSDNCLAPERRKEIIELIRKEVKPALGCTEPIAVALAVAKSAETACNGNRHEMLMRPDSKLKVAVSGNILKNGMGVGIPGTGMVGLHIAAALGAVCGKSEYGLEVLKDLTPATIEEAKKLTECGKVEILLAQTDKNLYVENCEMDSPNLDRVIRIKTSNCRGGVIENVFVRNIKVGVCREAVLRINLQYENREVCDRSFPPTVRNVLCENITCEGSNLGVYYVGLEGSDNVYNIQVDNCEFNNVKKGASNPEDGIYIKGGVKDVRFNNLKINGQTIKSPTL